MKAVFSEKDSSNCRSNLKDAFLKYFLLTVLNHVVRRKLFRPSQRRLKRYCELKWGRGTTIASNYG